MYIHIHIHIHMQTHTHTHTQCHIHIHIHIHIPMHMHTHIHIHCAHYSHSRHTAGALRRVWLCPAFSVCIGHICLCVVLPRPPRQARDERLAKTTREMHARGRGRQWLGAQCCPLQVSKGFDSRVSSNEGEFACLLMNARPHAKRCHRPWHVPLAAISRAYPAPATPHLFYCECVAMPCVPIPAATAPLPAVPASPPTSHNIRMIGIPVTS